MLYVSALLGLLVLGGAVHLFNQRRRKGRGADLWLALAPTLELELQRTPDGRARLAGRHRGRQLELAVTAHGWAEVRSRIDAPLPRGLHLLHRDTVRRLGLKGLRDTTIGEAPFDHDVVVHSDHPAAVIRLLRDAGARRAVHTLLREVPHAHVVGPDVYVRLPPATPEPEVRAALKRLCEAGDAVEEAAREVALGAEQAKALTRADPPPPLDDRKFLAFDEAFVQQREILHKAWLWRAGTYAVLSGPLALGTLFFLLGTTFRQDLPARLGFLWQMGGIFLAWAGIMGFAIGVMFYRCPACRELVKPINADPEDTDFGATSCRSCGVRLR